MPAFPPQSVPFRLSQHSDTAVKCRESSACAKPTLAARLLRPPELVPSNTAEQGITMAEHQCRGITTDTHARARARARAHDNHACHVQPIANCKTDCSLPEE